MRRINMQIAFVQSVKTRPGENKNLSQHGRNVRPKINKLPAMFERQLLNVFHTGLYIYPNTFEIRLLEAAGSPRPATPFNLFSNRHTSNQRLAERRTISRCRAVAPSWPIRSIKPKKAPAVKQTYERLRTHTPSHIVPCN